MKKVEVANVLLWGRRIGAVLWNDEQQVGTFEYESDFVDATHIQPSPFHMEKRRGTYQFPAENYQTFKGLPGMLADSLPDKFGNAIMESWLTRNNRSPGDFTPIERLCYIGKRGMGALEFEPSTVESSKSVDISLDLMVELASEILSDRESVREKFSKNPKDSDQTLRNLILIGSSAGGARAKCIIAYNRQTREIRSGQVNAPAGFEHYLLKMDGVSKNKDNELTDPQGYGRSEYAYYLMAKDCGIQMSESFLLEENGRSHFMTKRFDRNQDQKIHMQSLCGLRHFDFNQPGAHSYEQALETVRSLVTKSPKKALEQQFRRAVFNVVARNQDDHTKNISFLMDKQGNWSLSPAFDIAYNYNPRGDWTSRHQMKINGKRDNFELADLVLLGQHADLSEYQVTAVILEITKVVRKWREYFEQTGVPESIANAVDGSLRLNLIDENKE